MTELLSEYIIEQALIVIPVLLIIGKILKGTPKAKDWMIPYVLLASGVICTIALLGFSADAVIQGILVAGAAVFGNQLFKQVLERDGD